MSVNYARFTALVKLWPLSTGKSEVRDMAVMLRRRIDQTFPEQKVMLFCTLLVVISPLTLQDPANCDQIACERQYQALLDITENRHANEYTVKRFQKPGATGVCGLDIGEVNGSRSHSLKFLTHCS